MMMTLPHIHASSCDLQGVVQRFLRDFKEAFTPPGRRFEPNDPHEMTMLTVVVIVMIVSLVILESLPHIWRMLG